jgi:hypothetical protein
VGEDLVNNTNSTDLSSLNLEVDPKYNPHGELHWEHFPARGTWSLMWGENYCLVRFEPSPRPRLFIVFGAGIYETVKTVEEAKEMAELAAFGHIERSLEEAREFLLRVKKVEAVVSVKDFNALMDAAINFSS